MQPPFDIGMETRIRPILDTGNPAVFHRVPVDICDVPFKVFFIPDEMFPIPPLPDTPLPSGYPAFRSFFNRRQGLGETRFYQGPARLKISISRRQGQDTVKMLRQNDYCVD